MTAPPRGPLGHTRALPEGSYGDRWAPLLIAWTTPKQAPQLKGQVIGTGGSTHFSFGDGPKSFVTGSLELDAPQIAEDLDRSEGAAYATAVILHELGHVMGLEHVDDPTQLMYPEIGAPDGLAAGDLNGLYELATPSAARISSPQRSSASRASSTVSTRKILLHRPPCRQALLRWARPGTRRSQCLVPTRTMGVTVSGAP